MLFPTLWYNVVQGGAFLILYAAAAVSRLTEHANTIFLCSLTKINANFILFKHEEYITGIFCLSNEAGHGTRKQ